MTTPTADSTFIEGNGKPANDLESAKFTKDKETVDVVQPTAKLIGLTKEQLEQYRNDPFWKTVRYGLFIAFWLIWLAMFVGAILIVVMSPKCVDVKWHDKMVSYKIFTLAFNDADPSKDMNAKVGDFAGIKAKLGELKEMGISAIWPTPILETYKNAFTPESVVKLEVGGQLGGKDQLKDLIKSAHAKDMKVIVDLPLTVSTSEEGNWVKGIDNAIKQSSGNVAALNLKNEKVEESLVGLARQYIEWGIDGINLANYGMGNEDLAALVQKIRQIAGAEYMPIYSEMSTNGNNVYQSELLIGQEQAGMKELIGKLNANLDEMIKNNASISTTVWQLGSVNAKGHRVDELLKDASLTSKQKEKIAFLFTLAQLFMPSPISVLYGEELALLNGKASGDINNTNLVIYPWNNSVEYTEKGNKYFLASENADTNNYEDQKNRANSPLKIFTKLAKLHQQNDFILGTFKRISLGKLDAFLLKPTAESTSNAYGLIINWNGMDTELDGTTLDSQIQSKKLKIFASSDGGNFGDLIDFDAKDGQKVMIPAFGAVAFQTE